MHCAINDSRSSKIVKRRGPSARELKVDTFHNFLIWEKQRNQVEENGNDASSVCYLSSSLLRAD
jgi:hypothetical protein